VEDLERGRERGRRGLESRVRGCHGRVVWRASSKRKGYWVERARGRGDARASPRRHEKEKNIKRGFFFFFF
jgi:hypothetical protein